MPPVPHGVGATGHLPITGKLGIYVSNRCILFLALSLALARIFRCCSYGFLSFSVTAFPGLFVFELNAYFGGVNSKNTHTDRERERERERVNGSGRRLSSFRRRRPPARHHPPEAAGLYTLTRCKFIALLNVPDYAIEPNFTAW